MIRINLTNTYCKVSGDLRQLNKLRNELRFRHPSAWFLRPHMPKGWDGFIYDISETGTIKVGLIPKLIRKCKELDIEYEVDDNRDLKVLTSVPKKLGKFKLRDYQLLATNKLVYNSMDDIHFPVGVINAATNAGKTLIASAIHKSFKGAKTIVLLNSTDLFNQALREFPEIMPDENLGFIQGKKYQTWGNFTVAMVQTLSRDIRAYKMFLSKFDICITDEADLADNKTYRTVLNQLFNATVRVGMSGTIYLSTLKKDQLKNNNIRSYFGDEVVKISKQDLIRKGYSAKLVIKISPGGKGEPILGDYPREYENIITNNTFRQQQIINRLHFNIERGRIPILVICQYHNHVDRLYTIINEEFGKDFNVAYVHHKIKDRKQIFSDFRVGKIDILVSSMIVKRGQNLPLIKVIINAAGGDSHENISQIMGRGERKHESKTKTIIEDFADMGHYLKRHSKHRINYYRKEGFKVILLRGLKRY